MSPGMGHPAPLLAICASVSPPYSKKTSSLYSRLNIPPFTLKPFPFVPSQEIPLKSLSHSFYNPTLDAESLLSAFSTPG